ncbi:MAG: sugar ABC transporter substrate-binding protein [Chloroflexi bacterium]|nr:sugar ABC transporter substrate-binding protein [Chloroflexota bacterium]
MHRRFPRLVGVIAALSFVLTGWSTTSAATSSAAGSAAAGGLPLPRHNGVTLTVATVNNPDMVTVESLTSNFTNQTGIKVNYVTLPEDQLRDKVTTDVATGAGKFDIATIGTYDAPIWAKNKWVAPFGPLFNQLPAATRSAYNLGDIFPSVRDALSYKGALYAVPFYGESSMLYYRTDIFKSNHITMPLHPTWSQVAAAAQKVNSGSVHGICLRGVPGWGESLAVLDTVINTFGGRWYDTKWNAQLTSPAVKSAVNFYVNLVRKYGEPGASGDGFTECETLMATGRVAMWNDATVAAGFLEDPKQSLEAGKIGFAYAPVQKTPKGSHWLWAWSLAVEGASKNKAAAAEYIAWATSKQYIDLVGSSKGWVTIPPGTRASTYTNSNYLKAAGSFAGIVKSSILSANQHNATLLPVPYVGIQYVDIPEFQGLGTNVSNLISAAIAGRMSVASALSQAQKLAQDTAVKGGYKKG